MTILVALAGVAVFLVIQGIPALGAEPSDLNGKPNLLAYTAPLVFGTLWAALIAIVIATPLAIGVALAVSHYAPKRLASPLGYLVDLLAAVPSVVFGLWGRDVFLEPVREFSIWLNHYFSWLPIFGGDGPFGRSIMLGSLVLAIMVLPIVTSLSREVFQQTPLMNEEAALALGATKWEMIRTAVVPYGKPGVLAAIMLGLGRALGETIALALTLGIVFNISFNLIESGGNSIAANIANTFGEANATGRGALIASGLVLFAITLVVNMAARAIIYRRREFRDSAA